ncbi:MAG: hypothetical protein GY703_10155 [Gammaproteobacteria bacterium]|nr:hypothetical protein [Gammaproteobacteria bacterium]
MNQSQQSPAQENPFHPVKMVFIVMLIILGISAAAQWYATSITLPRYCDDPDRILDNVRKLLTEQNPAGEGDRKPYIIAARLTFLVPRQSEESLEPYLERLKSHINAQCP